MMQPEALAKLIIDEGVTFTAGVPTIWQGVLPAPGRQAAQAARHRLRRVRGARRRCRRPTASRSACRSCRRGA